MAQRDYISSKNRTARQENRRNTPVPHKQARGKSPYILIALILLILMIFVGILYYIMNNAPAEEVAQQTAQSSETIPPPPLDKWQYINDLESGSRPVDDSILDASNLEQEALNALIAQQIDPTTGQIISNPTPDVVAPANSGLNNQLEQAATNLPSVSNPQLPSDNLYAAPDALEQINNAQTQGQLVEPNSTIDALENELATIPTGTPVQNAQTSTMPDSTQQAPVITSNEATNQQALLEQQQREREQRELKLQAQKAEQARLQKQAEEKARKDRETAELQARKQREAAEAQARKEREAKAQAQVQVQPQSQAQSNIPTATPTPTGKGWQLQCGSFSDLSKAESLKALLAFKGMQARVVKAGQYNRVMLGPFSSRQDANSLISRAQAAGVPGCIILAP